jgi:hypothetical protein
VDGETRPLHSTVAFDGQMPSRQERRRAEREAAKRAPAQAGAAGAAGAGATPANVTANPLGHWTTQAADPGALFVALGAENVKRKAGEGDGEAQFSEGYRLLSVNEVEGTPLGSAGRSPEADAGSALVPHSVSVAHQTEVEVSLWPFVCLIKRCICGMPTLSGGGHGASGEGGGARACVCYGGVGLYSPRAEGA